MDWSDAIVDSLLLRLAGLAEERHSRAPPEIRIRTRLERGYVSETSGIKHPDPVKFPNQFRLSH